MRNHAVQDEVSLNPERVVDGSRQIRGNIPIRNPDFTGREDLLEALRTGLFDSRTAAVRPRALHGLGGVGKSQVALEYIYRFTDDYDLIWWIPAEQTSLVLTSLTNLSSDLGIPQNVDQRQTADAVLRKLGEGDRRWLLVFDNADQPGEILPLVPSAGGHVIITSRNFDWAAGASEPIEVNVFSRDESLALLRKRRDATTAEDADRLAETLGDLPLALDQARAWQAATGMGVAEYLDLLTTHTRELMDEGKPPQYPTTIAAFVSLALEKLRITNPGAAQLLELFAHLGAEPLSVDMLRRAREAAISEPLRPMLRDAIRLNRAICDLRRFGSAKVGAPQRIQVHRLAQMVLRESLNDAQLARSKENVQRILAAANPTDPDTVGRYGNIYDEIGSHIETAELINSQVHGARHAVLDQIRYLYVVGNYKDSRTLAEKAAGNWDRATGDGVGPMGELTLIAKRHLANALRDLGKRQDARALNAEVFASFEQSPEFGPDHEHTLAAASGVAADLRLAGDYRGALEIDELNVEKHRRIFGDEDSLTLRARSNSAVNQRMLGEFSGALDVDKELAEEWRKTVGEDDPRYMFCVVNSALDLNGQGRYAEALDALNRVFHRYQAQLGSGHVFVLRAARARGVALRKTGAYSSALAWSGENLHECQARLGDNHEITLAAQMSYANALRVCGRPMDARKLATDAVERYGRTFGPRHPLTLTARINTAIAYRALGEVREARQIDEAALADMTQLLGEDHGYTLCAAASFASDLSLAHDVRDAQALSEATLQRSRRVRGELHPYTLSCAVNAALDLQATGREPDGLALLERAVADLIQVLGADHPETLDADRYKRAECDIEPPPT
ncbi:FxSxx-COOH system tetratricopeptide repeat protein [Cryptosporangium aurantiacum]|uniref:Tetratricopeptide repeat-containing protein n=1 Tax=Cryptosporangium aurantiacum TaxID=134849 RepID=A0A1M7R1S4_9ACTN|nr:FxSxx-COOH system tetratricopeptide repeat protein [Cryptosporangium aurantiacum]SHN38637.1 Tetratricopeptide repeat-containing protein [Cryptosporangium aurantiacum]